MNDCSDISAIPPSEKILVINIFSFLYSGSTWLNLMLGSHPEAFSVGEIEAVCCGRPCICGVHGPECELWSRFDPTEDDNPLVQISRLSGKRCLVLSNPRNSLAWQQDTRIESRFIHLIRDGRAVVASTLRKHPDRRIRDCARDWQTRVLSHRRLLNEHIGAAPPTVMYERLQANTDGELRQVCDAVGLGFEPNMRQFWRKDHHYLWGNRGILFAMTRRRDANASQEDLPESVHAPETCWDLDYYVRTDPDNFVDERWRKELNPVQRVLFALTAGKLNLELGYR